jgi:hypothetical protein
MSRKYQLTLPGPVAEQLEQLAVAADLPPSTLAGQFVRSELERAADDGKVPAMRRPPARPAVAPRRDRPCWLEPQEGDPDWLAQMWARIVELYNRYPKALASLQDGWWTNRELLETLSALVTWRAEIDDGGVDAREELAFHLQLRDLSQQLRQTGGGVTKAWKPGVIPAEWRHTPSDHG